MSDAKNETGVDKSGTDSAKCGDLSESRRKLIKAGIIGVPVILTLKSDSAFANQKTPSAGSLTHASHAKP